MERQPGLAGTIVASATAALAVVVIAAGLREAPAGTLDFTWRWYAVPLLIAIGIHAMLLLRILLVRPSSRGMMYWFVLFMMASIFWLVALLGQALAATPEGGAYWQGVTPVACTCLVLSLTFFILSYLQDIDYPLPPGSWSLAVLSGVGIIVVASMTNLLETHVPAGATLELWGYQSQPGPYTPAVFAWYGVLATVCISMLVRAYKKATNPVRRRQLKLFIIGIGQYCSIAIVSDIVLYTLYPHSAFPLSFVYTTVLSLMIGYGITHYDVLRMSPAALSGPILENLSEAVIGVDAQLRIEFINKGAVVMLGAEESTLTGSAVLDLFGESDFAMVNSKLTAQEGNFVVEDISMAHLAHHNRIPVVLAVSSIYDNRGRVAGYIFVAQNVTALKRKTLELAQEKDNIEAKVVQRTAELHREQARLRASIENISLGFMMVGDDGKIVIQNKALQQVFGVNHAFGSLDELNEHVQDYNVSDQFSQVLHSGKPNEGSQLTAGTKILQIFMSPIPSADQSASRSSGVVILIEDITERSVMERSRDEFFSIASHELRTPLTAIRGNASMALEYYDRVNEDPSLQELVRDIHESSVRLIAIVNDFLDTSRLEQNKITFEPTECSLEGVVRAVVKEMKPVADDKNLDVTIDYESLEALPRLWLDQERFKQIMYNVVGNAVNYTEHGSVEVSASCDVGFVHLFVTDTGRGISLENQRLLFHKFQQAGHSLLTRDTTKGTGLGLYISRLLAEKMGGELVLVQSSVGKGSTFMLSLPITNANDASASGKQTARINTSTGLTITD